MEFSPGDQDIALNSVLAAEGTIEDEADGDFLEVELPQVSVFGSEVDGLRDVNSRIS